jgi:hypothetical protein
MFALRLARSIVPGVPLARARSSAEAVWPRALGSRLPRSSDRQGAEMVWHLVPGPVQSTTPVYFDSSLLNLTAILFEDGQIC